VKALVVSALLLSIAKPPPVVPEPLITACAGKQLGAPCSVTFGGTTKTGACVKLHDSTLACMQPRKR
jgi:hypothetical protein